MQNWVVGIYVVTETACIFRVPFGPVPALGTSSQPPNLPHPKVGSGLPLGFHSFPTAVCGPHLPPPVHGKLLESSDHLHLHISRAQHRSWHRTTVGGSLIIDVQTNLHAVGCHRRE